MRETGLLGIHGDIEYLLYRTEYLDGVKEVLYESFFKNECACIGTEVNLPESEQGRTDLLALSVDALLDGVSIVARDRRSNKIIACAVNKIQTPGKPDAPAFFDWFKDERCHSDSSRALIDFMIVLDAQLDLFEHYQIDCLFECMFLATLPAYEGRRIGRYLVEYSVQLAQRINRGECQDILSDAVRASGKCPAIVSAIFTGEFSQRIGRHLEFVEHAEVSYEHLEYKGVKYARRINNPIHGSAVLMAKRLSD